MWSAYAEDFGTASQPKVVRSREQVWEVIPARAHGRGKQKGTESVLTPYGEEVGYSISTPRRSTSMLLKRLTCSGRR